MVAVFRLLHLCAAILSGGAGVLIIASFYMSDRVPQSTEFLGIHLGVGAGFLGVGGLLLGLQRHVARIAAPAARGHDAATAQELAAHLSRLLAYLLAGGVRLPGSPEQPESTHTKH
jgi:hypothetical protein